MEFEMAGLDGWGAAAKRLCVGARRDADRLRTLWAAGWARENFLVLDGCADEGGEKGMRFERL